MGRAMEENAGRSGGAVLLGNLPETMRRARRGCTSSVRAAILRLRSRLGGAAERGAVAVEAALVTPFILLIFFGIIEYGMLFKDWLAATSSVRAGARIASAEPRVTTFAQDAADQSAREGAALDFSTLQKFWVYKSDAAGFPVGGNGSFSDCTVCVKFTWNATSKKLVPASDTWSSTTQNACQGDANHDRIGVYMALGHPSITGLLFSSITIKEHTVMNLEPMSSTTGCK
jgi:Flp pilus assembly protein TadG